MTYKSAIERDRADNLAGPISREKRTATRLNFKTSAVKIAPGTRDFQQTRIVGMLQSFQSTRTCAKGRRPRGGRLSLN
jgi:hypothetical protein